VPGDPRCQLKGGVEQLVVGHHGGHAAVGGDVIGAAVVGNYIVENGW